MKNPRNTQTQDCTGKKTPEYKLLLPVFWKWSVIGNWSQQHVTCNANKDNETNQMSPYISSFTVNFKNTLEAGRKGWHWRSVEVR